MMGGCVWYVRMGVRVCACSETVGMGDTVVCVHVCVMIREKEKIVVRTGG